MVVLFVYFAPMYSPLKTFTFFVMELSVIGTFAFFAGIVVCAFWSFVVFRLFFDLIAFDTGFHILKCSQNLSFLMALAKFNLKISYPLPSFDETCLLHHIVPLHIPLEFRHLRT